MLLVGCHTVETFNQEMPPEYMTATRADFFARGPAQATPPEKIEKDVFVKVLKKDSGFAVVKLLDAGGTGPPIGSCPQPKLDVGFS